MTRIYTLKQMADKQHDLNEEICAFSGKPWLEYLTEDMLNTQIFAELSELLSKDVGLVYKWWKSPDGKFDRFKLQMELIDAFHFFLGKWMLRAHNNGSIVPDLVVDISIEDFTLRHDDGSGVIFDELGRLDHQEFNKLVDVLGKHDIYEAIDKIMEAGDMTPSEFSAMYAAKCTLNSVRVSKGYREGKYTNKPKNGVEDTDRLQYIIDAFVHDEGFDLDDVVKSVMDEFFEVNHGEEAQKTE